MRGQLSIFDCFHDGAPCRYRFKRYVGQKVRIMIGAYIHATFKVGIIEKIEPYYTHVRCGHELLVATPTSLSEVNEEV